MRPIELTEEQLRLNRVTLPDKIKCVQCHRHSMHSKFSQKQLNDYRQRFLFEKKDPKLPKCRQCVGGPATELTCHRCELTKDLDAFTKVQRRKPDTALCKECQQEVDDVEPKIEDALQEQEILETQTSIGSHSLYNYDSLRGSQPGADSRAGGFEPGAVAPPCAMTSHNLLHFSSKSSIIGESDDGVWTGQHPIHGGKGGSGRKEPSHAGTAPSIAASATSVYGINTPWNGFNENDRSRVESNPSGMYSMSGKQSGNWARQRAVKPDRGALREAEKLREAQRKVQEQERARLEEEDDESSGSDWDL